MDVPSCCLRNRSGPLYQELCTSPVMYPFGLDPMRSPGSGRARLKSQSLIVCQRLRKLSGLMSLCRTPTL